MLSFRLMRQSFQLLSEFFRGADESCPETFRSRSSKIPRRSSDEICRHRVLYLRLGESGPRLGETRHQLVAAHLALVATRAASTGSTAAQATHIHSGIIFG